eukprot:GHVT01050754.1.p1 GENE.GHVT01050754.1~~GHVT01050754.1.p1  ORF type:complete len:233 (-),score=1.14 GHVT01050754.1:1098-1796(-)
MPSTAGEAGISAARLSPKELKKCRALMLGGRPTSARAFLAKRLGRRLGDEFEGHPDGPYDYVNDLEDGELSDSFYQRCGSYFLRFILPNEIECPPRGYLCARFTPEAEGPEWRNFCPLPKPGYECGMSTVKGLVCLAKDSHGLIYNVIDACVKYVRTGNVTEFLGVHCSDLAHLSHEDSSKPMISSNKPMVEIAFAFITMATLITIITCLRKIIGRKMNPVYNSVCRCIVNT